MNQESRSQQHDLYFGVRRSRCSRRSHTFADTTMEDSDDTAPAAASTPRPDHPALAELEDEVDYERDEDYEPPVVHNTRKSRRLQLKGVEPRPVVLKPAGPREKPTKLWEEWEKDQLLLACRKYGTKDWRRIAGDVPTKSAEMVKAYIKREKRNQTFTIETKLVQENGTEKMIDDGLKRLGRPPPPVEEDIDQPDLRPPGDIKEAVVRRDREAPLERWLGILEDQHRRQVAANQGGERVVDYSSSIPAALNWIADGEQHPNPEECGGIDYAAIYRYLAVLCEGEVPPDLNPASAARISILLSQMCEMVRDTSLAQEVEYLRNYRGTFTRFRGSGSRPVPPEAGNLLRGLSAVPGLNPLQLHPELFGARPMPGLENLLLSLGEEEEEEEMII